MAGKGSSQLETRTRWHEESGARNGTVLAGKKRVVFVEFPGGGGGGEDERWREIDRRAWRSGRFGSPKNARSPIR